MQIGDFILAITGCAECDECLETTARRSEIRVCGGGGLVEANLAEVQEVG